MNKNYFYSAVFHNYLKQPKFQYGVINMNVHTHQIEEVLYKEIEQYFEDFPRDTLQVRAFNEV